MSTNFEPVTGATKIGDGTTTYEKGDNYEGDTFSVVALVECVALRVLGRHDRRRHRSRKTSDAGGELGDREAGLTNIQRGMSGIHNWLDYLNDNFRFEFGQGWDPGGTIRAGIKSDLDMISSGKISIGRNSLPTERR